MTGVLALAAVGLVVGAVEVLRAAWDCMHSLSRSGATRPGSDRR
jgi:hypothetical protein